MVSWKARQSHRRTLSSSALCLATSMGASGRGGNSISRDALLEAEGAARGLDVGLDVGALERDLVRPHVERGDQRRHGELDGQRDRHEQRQLPAAHRHQHRGGEAGDDDQPLQRQADVLVDVVHADHEARGRCRASRSGPGRSGRPGPAGRPPPRRAGSATPGRLPGGRWGGRISRISLHLGKPVAQLPAARGDPVDQDGDDQPAPGRSRAARNRRAGRTGRRRAAGRRPGRARRRRPAPRPREPA